MFASYKFEAIKLLSIRILLNIITSNLVEWWDLYERNGRISNQNNPQRINEKKKEEKVFFSLSFSSSENLECYVVCGCVVMYMCVVAASVISKVEDELLLHSFLLIFNLNLYMWLGIFIPMFSRLCLYKRTFFSWTSVFLVCSCHCIYKYNSFSAGESNTDISPVFYFPSVRLMVDSDLWAKL